MVPDGRFCDVDTSQVSLVGTMSVRAELDLADVYRHLLDEPAVKAVLTFGLADRYTWLNEDRPRHDGHHRRPLPFGRHLRPKPAHDHARPGPRPPPPRRRRPRHGPGYWPPDSSRILSNVSSATDSPSRAPSPTTSGGGTGSSRSVRQRPQRRGATTSTW